MGACACTRTGSLSDLCACACTTQHIGVCICACARTGGLPAEWYAAEAGSGGRSDAVVYVDALGASFRFSQCFTRSDRFAWRFTDYNAGFEAGNERLCVYDTPASIDEI